MDSLLAISYELSSLSIGRYLFWWYYFVVFNVEWWLGKVGCHLCRVNGLQFLLATCGSLTGFFSVESFKGFFQEYPRYFEGIPLSHEEFMFDVPCYTAHNMTESEVVDLSKSEGVEYSQEVFLFSLATFTSGEIGVQGVRCFQEASSNVTRSCHAYH